MRIEEIKDRFQVKVQWKAFPLHPETPEQGLTLKELFAGRDLDVQSVVARW